MILQNNNFSVLPFYSSLDKQNSKRWWVNGKIYPLYMMRPNMLPFQILRDYSGEFTLRSFQIYNKDGLVRDYTTVARQYVSLKTFQQYGYEVIVCTGGAFLNLPNGRYYVEIMDDQDIFYSEWFTYVNDTRPYLRLRWWDSGDFIMDSGAIVYTSPTFRNTLYLPATIAKPEYQYEEEGESRDGFFFPTKQISTKRYRFTFFAPEYLLDVLRFVRLSENIKITAGEAVYNVDNILITPEWESQGDLAAVTCEFDTDTVAKKIGMAYVRGV